MSESGALQQSMAVEKSVDEHESCWYLPVGNFRAYVLPLCNVPLSSEIRSRHSETSTVDMPALEPRNSPSLLREPHFNLTKKILLPVKLEHAHPVIDLSSDSEGGPSRRAPKVSSERQVSSNRTFEKQ